MRPENVQPSVTAPELPGTPFEHVIDPDTLREVLTRPAELAEWLDGQLRATPPAEPDSQRRHHTQIGTAARVLGRHGISVERLRLAVDLAKRYGSADDVLRARVRLGHALHWAGDFRSAHSTFVRTLQDAGAAGPIERSFIHQHSGKCYFDEGRLDLAGRHFAEALRLRKQGNADVSLIRSSQVALRRSDRP